MERNAVALTPLKYFTMESEKMSTMNITKDEVDFLNALRDPEKCAEIISVLLSYGLLPLSREKQSGRQ